MSYQVPPRLGYVVDEESGSVYLMALPDGDPQVLSGTAGAIWRAAVSGADPVAAMVEAFPDEPRGLVRAQTTEFIGQLIAAGYLAERP
ncbi:MAG: PqqD family protein [Propionibacteriaceae bacterium]|nr:PqqD family protein [Propionibacteriaceae bacterium]